MLKVEVLVIVTVTDKTERTIKSFQGRGAADAMAALKNADRAMDLIFENDAAWTNDAKYRYKEQLEIHEEQMTQAGMDEVAKGRQGQPE